MQRFFIKKFLSSKPMEVARHYVDFEAKKGELEQVRPQIYERVLELQEAAISGSTDSEALQAGQTGLVDVTQKIEAMTKAMDRTDAEIEPALAKDFDRHAKGLPKLKQELAQRQAAATRRLHLAQTITAFFQGSDLAQLPSISDCLAELVKAVEAIKRDPEIFDFRDLADFVQFLENVWTTPVPNFVYESEGSEQDPNKRAHLAARNIAAYVAAGPGDLGVRRQHREGHLKQFKRLLLAAAREQAGVDAPTPAKAKGPGFLLPVYAFLTGKKE
jgi:hypothetical protein